MGNKKSSKETPEDIINLLTSLVEDIETCYKCVQYNVTSSEGGLIAAGERSSLARMKAGDWRSRRVRSRNRMRSRRSRRLKIRRSRRLGSRFGQISLRISLHAV